ncbi:MAG: fasciclin domain-containing protein [Pseudonocardia sp.]
MAALAISVTACGGSSTPTYPSTESAAPTTSSAPAETKSDGVTTAADVFGAACSKLPQGNAPGGLEAMGPQPVATAASTNPLLKTLVTAVKAAGLVETLNSQKAITVFAPSDTAFADVQKALGDAKFKALLANTEALGTVLKGHVIAERYDRAGLAKEGTVSTLSGSSLTVKDTGATLTVTDGSGATANVLCGNIPTANATVFVIDKVLMSGK